MFTTVGVLRHFTAGLVVLTIFAMYGDSRAQEGPNPGTTKSHSLYKGSRALQFRINDNFVLADFQGVALSEKKHISDKSAIRLGASLYFESSDTDEENRTMYTDTSFTSSDGDRNAQSLTLNLQYIHYPSIERTIKFYWGVGPTLRFQRDIRKSHSYDSSVDSSRNTKNDYNSWGVGGSGVLGAEWFAISNISFHTEYIFSISYNWAKIKNHDVSGPDLRTSTSETDGISMQASNVRFGLSLYF